jgi:hypothetical protein
MTVGQNPYELIRILGQSIEALARRIRVLETLEQPEAGMPGLGGAPSDAQYLTLAQDATLTAERRLTLAGGVSAVDNGANNDYAVTVHDAVTLDAGSDPALSLAGQVLDLDLSGVLTAVGEGPGVDVVSGYIVGVSLDLPLLSHGDGSPAEEYATLALAIASASSGDTILLPPGTYSGDITVPAGVTIQGMSIDDVLLTGQITLGDGAALEFLSVQRFLDDAGAIYGVVDGGGTAYLRNCVVNVTNATGAAYAVYMATGGEIRARDCRLLALAGSPGYAVYASNGNFYQFGGRAVGSQALLPYYTT